MISALYPAVDSVSPAQSNEAGVVAGLSIASDGIQHAVLWVGDQIVDLNNSGDHGLNAGAFGINALGRVSLQTETSAYDPNGEDFCAYGTHRVCTAAVWQGGRFIRLPTLGGNNSTVGNVNSRGQIPGVAETGTADSACASRLPAQKLQYQAVVWGPDQHTDTDEKKIGPSLKGLYKHDKLKNGKKVTDESVKAMINAGGNGMPAYADLLSEAEKADVIAYLKTL